MSFDETPDTAETESVPTWRMRSMRSHADRRKRTLMRQFVHATSVTKEASGGRKITSSERSGRRSRLRNEVTAGREEHFKKRYGKKHNSSRERNSGVLRPHHRK